MYFFVCTNIWELSHSCFDSCVAVLVVVAFVLLQKKQKKTAANFSLIVSLVSMHLITLHFLGRGREGKKNSHQTWSVVHIPQEHIFQLVRVGEFPSVNCSFSLSLLSHVLVCFGLFCCWLPYMVLCLSGKQKVKFFCTSAANLKWKLSGFLS